MGENVLWSNKLEKSFLMKKKWILEIGEGCQLIFLKSQAVLRGFHVYVCSESPIGKHGM